MKKIINDPPFMALIGATVLVALVLHGCKKQSSPPPPVEKEAIQLILTGTYDFSGKSLTGNMTLESGTTTASGAIGSPVKLGDFDKGTVKTCTVKIYPDGGHPFYFKNVALSGTQAVTGIKALDTTGFDTDKFAAEMVSPNGVNSTCTSPSITGYYSSSFTSDHANAYKDIIYKIAGWMGKPCTGVSAKNLVYGNVPPSGEYWSVNVPGRSGMTNAKYPDGGNVVTSAVMMYDQTRYDPIDIKKEAIKMFKQNTIPFTVEDDVVAKWYSFATTMRPQGSDKSYKFYADHEEQEGFNVGATITTSDYSDMTTYEAVPGSNSSILSTGSEDEFEFMPIKTRRVERGEKD